MTTIISLSELYERDKGVCWLCGNKVKPKQATRDHVVPKSLGGTNHRSNLKLAHAYCNSKRGNTKSLQDNIQIVWEKVKGRCIICELSISMDWKEVCFYYHRQFLVHRVCREKQNKTIK